MFIGVEHRIGVAHNQRNGPTHTSPFDEIIEVPYVVFRILVSLLYLKGYVDSFYAEHFVEFFEQFPLLVKVETGDLLEMQFL